MVEKITDCIGDMMVKYRNTPIGKEDIEEYLKGYSDFSFEILVKRQLSLLGFDVQHGGTYEDPVTGKAREFDIRAVKVVNLAENLIFRLCLSVECKNIREYFPLVIHCTPRTLKEAYQELVVSSRNTSPVTFNKFGFPLIVKGDRSVYPAKDPVGKSCDQVGRKEGKDAELVSNDGDVFDKISQAINSSFDMLKHSHFQGDDKFTVVSSVVPVLVVPERRLWTVWYDNQGNIEQGPTQTQAVSYYIDRSYCFDEMPGSLQNYSLSHLEIITFDFLNNFMQKHMDDDRFSRTTLLEMICGIK